MANEREREILVPCSYCGAKAGELCTSRRQDRVTVWHRGRRRAAQAAPSPLCACGCGKPARWASAACAEGGEERLGDG